MRRRRTERPFGRSLHWIRDEGGGRLPRRWSRPRDPWEEGDEAFEGATALEDLPGCVGDPVGTARVLARYAAVRVALRAASCTAPELALEREAAARYIAAAAAGPPMRAGRVDRVGARRRAWERRALDTVVRLASARPSPDLCAALLDAGDEAAAATHGQGAFALYRAGYRLAVAAGYPDIAAGCAAGIGGLAEAGGGARSARLWRRRERILHRRAAGSAASSRRPAHA